MKPALYLALNSSTRKYVYIALVTMAVILALPVMAVFALGTDTLSFLTNTSTPTSGSGATTVGLYQGAAVSGDSYAWGNCTYWVYYLRQQAADPIPTTWGNAATWSVNAIFQGYVVDHTPTVGAIMQTPNVDDGLGHVAYVTAVDSVTGTWTISEMNVQGLDIVDIRSYAASAALGFNFIHDKVSVPVVSNVTKGLL
jgi:surface antigen